MTASRCMCLSWCLRSTCDDFFQAKEISIKGRLIKVRLESLGTAIFQRSRYTLAAHNWSMPFTNCSSIQEESTLDQHSPVHEIFNYLTATFPVHHYPEPTRTLPHASIPWNQSAKSWPEAVNLHLNIVMPGKMLHSWERGGASSTEKNDLNLLKVWTCCWGLGVMVGQFLPPRLSGTSLALYKLMPGPKHQPPGHESSNMIDIGKANKKTMGRVSEWEICYPPVN